VAAVVYVRLRLLSTPLERDEGEYALGGELILRGEPFYSRLHTMKLPGTHAAYALAMSVFGHTTEGVHLGLLAAGLAATGLVFLLGRRLADATVGAFAAAAYAALSLSPSVLGLSAHATQFVVVAALGGLVLLERAVAARGTWTLAAAGLCLGLAPVMKQAGAAFVVFGAARLVFAERPRSARRLGLFAAAAAAPTALTLAWVAAAGDYEVFRFWTVDYGRAYSAETGLAAGARIFAGTFPSVAAPGALLWVAAGVGLAARAWDERARASAAYLGGLAAVSFAATCPGLFFREHYFVVLLPAVALLAAVCLRSLDRWRLGRVVAPALAALALAQPFAARADVLFRLSPPLASRATYRQNPFPEAVAVGDWLRANSAADDRVAVLGSEPEILFYADRRSATGYPYLYPLTENQPYAAAMERDMIGGLDRSEPRFVVLVDVPISWLRQGPGGQALIDWFRRHRPAFDLVMSVDVREDASAPIQLGDGAERAAAPKLRLAVYRRR
jgi:hypothetical protein